MNVRPVQTPVFTPPQVDFFAVIDTLDLELTDGSVLAVSAKIVAIHQGRCVLMEQDLTAVAAQKDMLITAEAEWYLERDTSIPYPRIFTIYEGTFCSASGIDASNSNGYWTLLPKESSHFAATVRTYLQKKYEVKDVGVIVVDSRSYPMRNGTIGVTLGYAGFLPEFDYREKKDLFGRPFHAERINVADCLASTATLAMGEGDEGTPLAVMTDISHIVFSEDVAIEDPLMQLKVPMEEDVFAQFYRDKNWQRGGRNNAQ